MKRPLYFIKRFLYWITLLGCLALSVFMIVMSFNEDEAAVVALILMFIAFALVAVPQIRGRQPKQPPNGAYDREPWRRALLRAWNAGGKETIDDFGRIELDDAVASLRMAALLTEEVATMVEGRVTTSRIRESIALRARGEFAAAAAAIDSGTGEDVERDVSALTARGLGHLGSGKRDQALEDFRRADRRLAHMAGAVESNMAAALIEQGELEDARRAAERGIEHMARSAQTRGHWLPHAYRVAALELSGDADGAAVALQAMAAAVKDPGERPKAAAYLKRQAPLAALRRRVDIDEVFEVNG